MPPSPPAVDTPAEAALVEPLLPPNNSNASTEQQEAAVVSLIPEDETPLVGAYGQSAQAGGEEPELIVVSMDDSGWEHGEDQELKFQNPMFAFIFLVQAITVTVFGIRAIKTFVSSAPADGSNPQDDDAHGNGGGIDINLVLYYSRHMLFAFLATAASIILLSATTLSYLLRQTGATRRMIEMSLIIAPASYFIAVIGSLSMGNLPMAGMFLLMALFSICYVYTVWKRIPVAAANLAVAMSAVKAYQGSLITLGYSMTLVAAAWTCLWLLAIGDIGVRDYSFFFQCNGPNQDQDCNVTSGGVCVALLLLLSLLWTLQVIKNLCHTTVAGVVGSWWFSSPSTAEDVENGDDALLRDLAPSPKRVVYDSWVRSSVYSFGSICFGALVVGLLQVVQLVVRCGRDRNRENRRSSSGLLLCICQCIVDHLERLAEYMNKWAFVYVGLYGYDYWTAGSKVFNLFKARGWSVILNDHLIARYLTLLQILLSFLSAVICQFWGWLFLIRPLREALRQAASEGGESPNGGNGEANLSMLWYSFFSIGFVLGMSLSSVLFRLIGSAVDTIVVCFAEAPNQLSVLGQQPRRPDQKPILRPSLANEMILAWRQVYPNECGF